MQCEECGRQPATVHLTEIVNGQQSDYHLCETCAREKGLKAYQAIAGAFSVNQLLSGLMHLNQGAGDPRQDPRAVRCDACGMTFGQFAQVGRLGCPHCYQAFADGLSPLLRKVQSAEQHVGKVPARRGGTIVAKRELHELRARLQGAVAAERYEEAAALRDQLRALEQRLRGSAS